MLKTQTKKLVTILIALSFIVSFFVMNTNEKNKVSAATINYKCISTSAIISTPEAGTLIKIWESIFNNIPQKWSQYVENVYFYTQEDFISLLKANPNYAMASAGNSAVNIKLTKFDSSNIEVINTKDSGTLTYIAYHEIAHLIDKRYGENKLRPYSGEEGIYKVGGKNFYEIWRASNWEQDRLYSEAFALAVGRYKYEELEKVNQKIPPEVRDYLKVFISDIEAGRTGDVNIKLIGDVNCDLIISTSDVTLLAKAISNKATLTPQGKINANCHVNKAVNGDQEINGEDLLALQKYLSDRTLVLPLS